MPVVITPYIPESITVHLGPPGSDAGNVTLPFADYVKNVASSEIYPTWNESALRANILAITSFALNRVYTEFYRSRGYPYEITSSTAYDQKFTPGRNIFDNISILVDELFDDYLRRQGFAEPLAAKFCNGTTVTCEGLSQWGSEYLAREGYSSVDIIHTYYGDDVEIVADAPVQSIMESYPGTPLRRGSVGGDVATLQISLNRISQNYPAIPKLSVDGTFGSRTEDAVKEFQRIFDLVPDGVVGRATWYAIARTYVAVLSLAELQSQGQTYFTRVQWQYPDALSQGSTGERVRLLQYMLSVLSRFIPQVSPLNIDGVYGPATAESVSGFQRYASLPVTGVVDDTTWDAIYDEFAGIESTVFDENVLFPTAQQAVTTAAQQAPAVDHSSSSRFLQFPSQPLVRGSRDAQQEVRK